MTTATWKGYEKLLFRFSFLYFGLQALPLDAAYFRRLFSINWAGLHYGDIFEMTRYMPRFFPGPDSFANWGVVAITAVVAALAWSLLDRERLQYRALYYWLRVVLRYRLAIGLLGYGFLKLFPLQAPPPSISSLNTRYGDLTAWKIFSLSLGIVPGYEAFLGLVEVTAGLLLLFRKTATIGAFIVVLFTGNVFLSNLAYEGGEYVYAAYLLAIALFLLAFDAQRLYSLLVLERPTRPGPAAPVLPGKWKGARLVLKSAVICFFVVLYGYKTYSGYRHAPYQYPKTPGLAGAAGLYNVSLFRINNRELPYSATDPVRWRDVVFEKWNTLSIRSNRPVKIDTADVEQIHRDDAARNYELAGSAGRHYYSYRIDTVQSLLLLQHRNSHYAGETLLLRYSRPDSARIILRGVNERRDSIYVVLERLDKKYLLEEARQGRDKGIKL